MTTHLKSYSQDSTFLMDYILFELAEQERFLDSVIIDSEYGDIILVSSYFLDTTFCSWINTLNNDNIISRVSSELVIGYVAVNEITKLRARSWINLIEVNCHDEVPTHVVLQCIDLNSRIGVEYYIDYNQDSHAIKVVDSVQLEDVGYRYLVRPIEF